MMTNNSHTLFEVSKRFLQNSINIKNIADQILKQKSTLKTIHVHHFNDHEIEKIINSLRFCGNLEEIDLSQNMTEDSQSASLIDLIVSLPKLKILDLSHSFLSERGIIGIARVCSLNNIELKIAYNRMAHERTSLYQKNFVVPKTKFRSYGNSENIMPINQDILIKTIPNYQQDYNYDCGATTILDIHDYFNQILNKNVRPTSAELISSINTCSLVGAEIENMVRWFEAHDYETMGEFGGTEEMLRHYTNLGIPIIINTNEWGGHYIVVIGFEAFDPIWPQKDKIWCCDPLDYQQGNFDPTMPFSKRNLLQFLDQWLDSQRREGGYIVALPRELSDKFPQWKFRP